MIDFKFMDCWRLSGDTEPINYIAKNISLMAFRAIVVVMLALYGRDTVLIPAFIYAFGRPICCGGK